MIHLRQTPWLAAAFFISGMSLVFYSYSETKRDLFFLLKGQKAQGKVLGQVYREAENSNSHQKKYYPLISFQHEGRDTLFESDRGSSRPVLRTGDSVGVMYFDKRPHLAVVNAFSVVWLKPLIFLLTGLGCLITAILLAYDLRKSADRT